MRPVNLLPPKHRPHQPTGSKSGSAYILVGTLAVCLLAVVAYVSETNKITSAKSDTAKAQQRTAEAKTRSQQLGPFANFSQIKEQRVASVRQLAEGRFDWERSVRELAHVLPEGVWLRDFEASVTPTDDGGGTEGAPTGPSMKLHGCAQNQAQVATLLVRMREMQGVKDVKLTDSVRGQQDATAAPAAEGDSAAPTGDDSCGSHKSKSNYEFNAVVEFDPAKPTARDAAAKTPVRLGGGS